MATERETRLAILLDWIDSIADNAIAPFDDGPAAKFDRICQALTEADWLNADIVAILQDEDVAWYAANAETGE